MWPQSTPHKPSLSLPQATSLRADSNPKWFHLLWNDCRKTGAWEAAGAQRGLMCFVGHWMESLSSHQPGLRMSLPTTPTGAAKSTDRYSKSWVPHGTHVHGCFPEVCVPFSNPIPLKELGVSPPLPGADGLCPAICLSSSGGLAEAQEPRASYRALLTPLWTPNLLQPPKDKAK